MRFCHKRRQEKYEKFLFSLKLAKSGNKSPLKMGAARQEETEIIPRVKVVHPYVRNIRS
jgi:hypothetical protein